MAEKTEIDTLNKQMVAVNGGDIIVMNPRHRMSKPDAILHAAWLVALADESEDNADFRRVLEAVMSL